MRGDARRLAQGHAPWDRGRVPADRRRDGLGSVPTPWIRPSASPPTAWSRCYRTTERTGKSRGASCTRPSLSGSTVHPRAWTRLPGRPAESAPAGACRSRCCTPDTNQQRQARLPEIERPAQRQNQALDIAVREVTSRHPGLEVVPLLIHGPPSDSLLMAARSAQMLVLGSRRSAASPSCSDLWPWTSPPARRAPSCSYVRGARQDEHLRTILVVPSSRTPYRPVVSRLDAQRRRRTPCFRLRRGDHACDAPLPVIHAWKVPPLYSYGRAYDPRPTPGIDAVRASSRRL